MRAIALRRYGGPEVLEQLELPEPKVGPDSVLIRTRAAGVNPVDCKVREGRLDERMPAHFPLIPGWDVAGVIERVGPAVRDYRAGDEVIAYNRQDHLQWGTYAEFVSAPVRTLGRRPVSVGWAEAAALPLAGLTAYQALTEGLELAAGETVLIHAAAGGVGSMAVQIAGILGARVLGTASPANHDYLRGLGAEPVAYGPGLADRVRAAHPEGVDAVFDLVGGATLAASLELLRLPHRITSIVDPAGVAALGGRYVFVAANAAQLAQLAAWVDDGRLRIEVAARFPLAQAADAQRLLEAGHVRGKVVLTLEPEPPTPPPPPPPPAAPGA